MDFNVINRDLLNTLIKDNKTMNGQEQDFYIGNA